jgi:ribosomal-protein-alanine N-acetyltransferase
MPTLPTLHTERLTLRPFTLDDAPVYFAAVRSDPEVTRWIGGGQHESAAVTREMLARVIRHGDEFGYSLWAVIEKGALIGHAGLWQIPNVPDTEIAYALAKPAWGKGYATEAGRAVLSFAFDAAQLPRVIGLAFEPNAASRRVLTKLGMTFIGMTDRYYNVRLAAYQIERQTP